MAYSEALPEDFDVVAIGTGLPESILAAACARLGSTVLHLDKNEYYGGYWASFNMEGLENWAERNKAAGASEAFPTEELQHFLGENERLLPLQKHYSCIANVRSTWHIPDKTTADEEAEAIASHSQGTSSVTESSHSVSSEKPSSTAVDSESDEKTEVDLTKEENESAAKMDLGEISAEEKDSSQSDKEKVLELVAEMSLGQPGATEVETDIGAGGDTPAAEPVPPKPIIWSKSRIMKNWRRFSLDLTPKVLLGRGPMVELLISSDVGRYAEFKVVNRILTLMNGEIKEVPCSRAEVFQSKEVSILEKRILMKFLTFCLNSETDEQSLEGVDDSTFVSFMDSHKMTSTLKHYVFHSIAMVNQNAAARQGISAVYKFLMSTGRYGHSPFLFPLYGSGELPQCYCRLCAVFGGTYCLRRECEALVLDAENKCVAVITEGQRITARSLIIEQSYIRSLKSSQEFLICRGILLTDKSVLPATAAKQKISLLTFEAPGFVEPVKILELGSGAMVCPEDLYVVYLFGILSSSQDASSALQPVVDQFFGKYAPEDAEATKPGILWSMYYNQIMPSYESAAESDPTQLPSNAIIAPLPGAEIDYEQVLKLVHAEFERLWPDEEFLPEAPRPDNIALSDEPDPGINGYVPPLDEAEPVTAGAPSMAPRATAHETGPPSAENSPGDNLDDLDTPVTQPDSVI